MARDLALKIGKPLRLRLQPDGSHFCRYLRLRERGAQRLTLGACGIELVRLRLGVGLQARNSLLSLGPRSAGLRHLTLRLLADLHHLLRRYVRAQPM